MRFSHICIVHEGSLRPKAIRLVSSLVAQFCVFLIRLRHTNHLRYGHGVDLAESLGQEIDVSLYMPKCSYCISSFITGGSTNLPHSRIPRERPAPEQPPLVIMQPPPRAYEVVDTHILEGAVRELAVPFVFDLCDLARRLIVEDVDFAVDGLLFANTLHDIACTQVHGDWVAAGGDFVVEALDFREGGLQAVPLRFVLLAADGLGDGIFEDALIVPQLELLQ